MFEKKHFIAVFFVIAALFAAFPLSSHAEDTDGDVVVTGAREAELRKETPASVGVIKKDEIETVKPTHPSEILNRVPGVWVNVTAGEGHITAIRQPLTTNPVYLFLEDGIPVRSTGFFNHNALYEVNLSSAERIEVYKGPATALYGSDAIGGSINSITKAAPLKAEVTVNPEAGENGWMRLLASAGDTWGANGLRLDVNRTEYYGWRDRSGYEKTSAVLRWDYASGAASIKTVISYADIWQDTGGANGLLYQDYKHRSWYNYQTFDFRGVESLRLSSAYERELGASSLLSVTPYVRVSRMELLPGWGIFQAGPNYFGYDSSTDYVSYGLLAKYRHDMPESRTRFIAGVDVDYTPGAYNERRIQVFKTGDKYTSYTYVASTANDYDYEAVFTGVSPYMQLESSLTDRLRAIAGLRYDSLSYDYDTSLTANANRPASTKRSFEHLSPKAGLTYGFTDKVSGFANYGHAFRVPSSADLFRGSQGTALTAVNLKPIKADSYEAGLRGGDKALGFEVSWYYMTKKDDIVTYSVATNINERRNAGVTVHKGVELSLTAAPIETVELALSYSNARHVYDDYAPSALIDYSGNYIPQAPAELITLRGSYKPALLNGGRAELEWTRVGAYWMDDANTEKYKGHDVLNARLSFKPVKSIELYVRAMNLSDKRYAERATKAGASPSQYAPGQPRAFFAGFSYKWEAEG
ncbi:MAG: TonB-dependent receptor [Deltaproteobacteria bacterium]|nr:TonB-dependent receptor [Deltaproteobacteria bacterium]